MPRGTIRGSIQPNRMRRNGSRYQVRRSPTPPLVADISVRPSLWAPEPYSSEVLTSMCMISWARCAKVALRLRWAASPAIHTAERGR